MHVIDICYFNQIQDCVWHTKYVFLYNIGDLLNLQEKKPSLYFTPYKCKIFKIIIIFTGIYAIPYLKVLLNSDLPYVSTRLHWPLETSILLSVASVLHSLDMFRRYLKVTNIK